VGRFLDQPLATPAVLFLAMAVMCALAPALGINVLGELILNTATALPATLLIVRLREAK
jgi:hypothetical protein